MAQKQNCDFGFILTSDYLGDDRKLRAVAKFVCSQCDNLLSMPISAGTLNPTLIAQRATRQGWIAHPYKKTKATCPTCRGPKIVKAIPETMSPGIIEMPAPKNNDVRDPTGDQRMAIRTALDKHFDDAQGMYLDGFSDQLIAEKVDVPRVVVERIRESAYGPIRVDPILVAMHADLAALKDDMVKLQQRIAQLEARLVGHETRLAS